MGETSRVVARPSGRNLGVKPNLSGGANERLSMSHELPVVHLARHGNTAWTRSGQHTGLTDLPLTPDGERNAVRLGDRLKGLTFAKVFTSPLQRAARTCELAGFGAAAETDPDLVEWNYGKYEGLTFAQILQQRPDWDLFRDGCPGGESPQQIGERAYRVVPNGSGACLETFCSFRAGTLCACWRRVGWVWARWRQIFSAKPRQSQCAQLRTRSVPACGSVVGRRSPCGSVSNNPRNLSIP